MEGLVVPSARHLDGHQGRRHGVRARRARFVVGTVIQRDPADEISLGLVGDHHLSEVSALGGELDNVAGDDLADEIRRDLGALGFELA